jgi:hypothetical protein
MERTKTVLIWILLATSASAAAILWRQTSVPVSGAALAAPVAPPAAEQAEILRARLARLEAENEQLLADLIAARNAAAEAEERAAAAAAPGVTNPAATPSSGGAWGGRGEGGWPGAGGGMPGGPGGGQWLLSMLEDPDIAPLFLAQRKAQLDQRYAALFRQLNLAPEQADQLKNLLAEKQLARTEAFALARAEGIGRGSRDEVRAMIEQSDREIDARIRDFLGESGFAALQTYEQTYSSRTRVDQFAQRLSYSPTPLAPQQTENLVRLTANLPAPRAPNRSATAAEAAAYFEAKAAYDAQLLQQARSFLSPQQLQALARYQEEQNDQVRLNLLMRDRVRPTQQGQQRPRGPGS